MSEQITPQRWQYGMDYTGPEVLPDPRIAVAKWLGWTKNHNVQTENAVPEPDNYNRAIWNLTPVDCHIIEDQVIYRDQKNSAWITLMYVPPESTAEYDAWQTVFVPSAAWQHLGAPPIKTRRLL
tara:strand:+ start:2772 stop:3143 length:372 start_codon:yes stop_codon:yes gene_type:complete